MLSFEEIEDCMPDGAASLPDGWTGVTAQWLHDFAHAIAAKEREACAKVCDANAEHWRGMLTTANPRAEEFVLRGYSVREDSAADCATNIRGRPTPEITGAPSGASG